MSTTTAMSITPVTLANTDLGSYLPIFLMVVAALGFGVGNVAISKLLGPSRPGARKGVAYESGMNPITSSRKRFNVRFYLIAMVFLVFDVEVIFLYPWAATFANLEPMTAQSLTWLARILFFLFTTVIAYVYGYRKGVFRFD